jgi:hypothetical protein
MIESIDDLIVFLKHFRRNLLTDPSLPPERIPAYLPEGLAKIYREFGRFFSTSHPDAFGTNDKLVHVSQLHQLDGMLEFCWESQGVWSARCPINQKDPPVYSNDSSYGKGWNVEEDFVVVCESLNHFLITFCLGEAVAGSRNIAMVNNADNILETIVEQEKFQPLWLDGKYVYSDWLRDFYISEDRDILIWNHGWVGSQTRPLMDIFDPNIDSKIKVNMFGVDLPRRYWTKLSEWKPQWLLDEENAGIRRVLIQQIGYDRICQELDAIDLDTWREYTLLKIEANGEDEPMVLLKMTCPSTGHIHILRVPPEMTSAEAAITWVNHGIHPDKFAVQT